VLLETGITEESQGVGALSKLSGEITIDGDRVLVSRSLGPDDVTATTGVADGDAASMLFMGMVSSWTDVPITGAVAPMKLDDRLADAFADQGAQTGPVPFRIEGEFTDVRLHIIGGQCPIRSRMHGEPMTRPGFELTVPKLKATVVGNYASDTAGGITHMGSDTHMHIIVEHDGQLITGHVESIGVLPGSTLKLPATTR
jgi:acetolactate decarboxylase